MTGIYGRRLIGRVLFIGVLVAFAGVQAMAQSGSSGDVFTHTVAIKRQPADVWAGLVTKSIVDSYYFAPISADLTKVGQQFYYGQEGQQLITGKVLELQGPTKFTHSFMFAGEEQPGSIVTYSLTANGETTVLTVTHQGYGRDTQPYADIAGGWPIILDGLKAKLEAN